MSSFIEDLRARAARRLARIGFPEADEARTAAPTFSGRLTTRLTEATETPASRATS